MSEKTFKKTTIVVESYNNCCERFQRKPKKRKRHYCIKRRILLPIYYNNSNNNNNTINPTNPIKELKSFKIIVKPKVMLIDVMANNVMLSKCIQRSTQLQNCLKSLSNKDYCFELSPHDFGGPPLYLQLQEQQQKQKLHQKLIIYYSDYEQQPAATITASQNIQTKFLPTCKAGTAASSIAEATANDDNS